MGGPDRRQSAAVLDVAAGARPPQPVLRRARAQGHGARSRHQRALPRHPEHRSRRRPTSRMASPWPLPGRTLRRRCRHQLFSPAAVPLRCSTRWRRAGRCSTRPSWLATSAWAGRATPTSCSAPANCSTCRARPRRGGRLREHVDRAPPGGRSCSASRARRSRATPPPAISASRADRRHEATVVASDGTIARALATSRGRSRRS